jgi:transposase
MALADDQPKAFLADKGYDSDAIRDDLRERHITPVIPSRSNRKKVVRYNKKLYKARNRIERLFGHLKMQRAVATRFDKLARSFLDTLHLATIKRCLRYATL